MRFVSLLINTFKRIGYDWLFPSHEPKIEQKRDHHGNLYWQVYDLTTNKTYSFGSDRDVRAWIEQKYHDL